MTTGIDLGKTVHDLPRSEPWITCPACGEEWTMLRECFWFEGENSKIKQTSSICVQCAESLRSFQWIMDTWPIVKPFENWADDWLEAYAFFPGDRKNYAFVNSYNPETRQPFKEKVMFWKNKIAFVRAFHGKKPENPKSENAILAYTLRGDMVTGKIAALDQKNRENEMIVYDNAIEAWVGMKMRIIKAVTAKEEIEKQEKEIWGNGKKPFKRF